MPPNLSASRNHGDWQAGAGAWRCVAGALPGPGLDMAGSPTALKQRALGSHPHTARHACLWRVDPAGPGFFTPVCTPLRGGHPGPLRHLLPTPAPSQGLQSRFFFAMEQLPLTQVVSGNFNESVSSPLPHGGRGRAEPKAEMQLLSPAELMAPDSGVWGGKASLLTAESSSRASQRVTSGL